MEKEMFTIWWRKVEEVCGRARWDRSHVKISKEPCGIFFMLLYVWHSLVRQGGARIRTTLVAICTMQATLGNIIGCARSFTFLMALTFTLGCHVGIPPALIGFLPSDWIALAPHSPLVLWMPWILSLMAGSSACQMVSGRDSCGLAYRLVVEQLICL